MRFPGGFFKLGIAIGGAGCAALLGFALNGAAGALYWPVAAPDAPSRDYVSYFSEQPAATEHDGSPVRHLGLSADFDESTSDEIAISALSGTPGAALAETALLDPSQDPHLQPENVSIGDRVTLVTPDGVSYVYRVMARENVDVADKSATGDSKPDQTAGSDESCAALKTLAAGAFRLVIESVKAENHSSIDGEQKL